MIGEICLPRSTTSLRQQRQKLDINSSARFYHYNKISIPDRFMNLNVFFPFAKYANKEIFLFMFLYDECKMIRILIDVLKVLCEENCFAIIGVRHYDKQTKSYSFLSHGTYISKEGVFSIVLPTLFLVINKCLINTKFYYPSNSC